MRRLPKVWRLLYAWSRRRPGMKIVVSGTPHHDGIWLRPRFIDDHHETCHTWVNIETGDVLSHFTEIPEDAKIRRYGYSAPESLEGN